MDTLGCGFDLSQSAANDLEVTMTNLLNLQSFRLLAVGGAKASTNDDSGGPDIEHDQVRYTLA
jgi:hypothetical protein